MNDRLLVIRRVLLLIPLLLIPACGSPPVPLPGPAPVQPLTEDVLAPIAELMMAEDRRSYDPSRIAELAEHEIGEVRRRTALALARLRRPESLPLLTELLADPDSSVSATAAFALGQVGDTLAVEALAAVLRAPAASRITTSAEAAAALGKLRTASASAALTAFLAEAPVSSSGDPVLEAALLAIWRHPRDPDPTPVLRWLSAEDPELRWRAAYALTRRPEPVATGELLRLAGDTDPRVRANAVRGLTGALTDSAGIDRRRVETTLLDRTSDSDYATRINALRTLGTFASPAVVERLRERLDADDHEAIVSAEALGRVGAPAASAAAVLRTLAGDAARPVGLRTTALAALLEIDPAGAESVAEGMSAAPAWRDRAAAARALARFGPPDRPTLVRLIRDADARVAASALSAGADSTVAERPAPVLLLVEALGLSDVGIRTAALRALARHRDPATLAIILDAYDKAQGDLEIDAGLAAIDALAALEAVGVPVTNPFFRRFGRPDDALLRERAANRFGDRALTAWGEAFPTDTRRSHQDYLRLARVHVFDPLTTRSLPRAIITTDAGAIEIEFFAPDAPLTVESFLDLADQGYFDGQEWPRVVPNFVVQGGDPRGDQTGGPGYAIRDEINRHRYGTGTVGMALSGPDTGGSQFFVTHSPQPHLDGGYTAFGRTIHAVEILERIAVGDRIHSVRPIERGGTTRNDD